MHSSRMRTTRLIDHIWGGVCPGGVCPGGCLPRGCLSRGLSVQGACLPGGVCPGGVCPGGVPCRLSHHAFDVTCILSWHQLRLITSAAVYIVSGHVTCGASWDTQFPPVDRMTDTCKNITFSQTLFAGGKYQGVTNQIESHSRILSTVTVRQLAYMRKAPLKRFRATCQNVGGKPYR